MRHHPRFAVCLFAVALLFIFSGVAMSQEITGSIVGAVKDANGAAVKGATVTVTDSGTKLVVRTVQTDDEGQYAARDLSVTKYDVTVEASNFKKHIEKNVQIDVGKRRSLDITLEAGNISEVVSVQAGQMAVELATPTVSSLGGAFSVHGQTDATFDGGTGKVAHQKATASKTCTDCPDGQCMHVTGTLVVTYHVDVTVTMPDVPEGLNACEEAKVRQFINTTLRQHENDHVRRFRTYNGTKSIPVNITACGESDAATQVQQLHDTDEQKRQSDAQALSDAIDPFTKSIDLSDCQK